MKLQNLSIVISIIVLVTGCQTSPPQLASHTSPEAIVAAVPKALNRTSTKTATTTAGRAALLPRGDLWVRIRENLSWQFTAKPQIESARERFLRQPNFLPVVASRASFYLYYIVEEVEKRGMPMEIALLPLVESTLNPFAVSSSRAAGLWQIMPATGRHLKLEQNWWYDGRRALRDSTTAALDYLEALHAQFDDDWLLALAAYNSGNGRVSRAQRANAAKGRNTDYWSLRLPRETRNYLPKLIALAQIVAEPERYGVVIPSVPNTPFFEVAATGGQLELARAAELAGIDVDTLRALNPGQLRWATSPDRPAELLLPLGTSGRFAQGIAQLGADERVQWQHYRIRRGDSLSRIAKTFSTQVKLIQQVNGLRGSRIRAGDTLMIPQGDAWASSLALASNHTATEQGYRVRRGDSLFRIANKFKVSVNEIVAWNELDPGKYLQPGQKLTLFVNGG